MSEMIDRVARVIDPDAYAPFTLTWPPQKHRRRKAEATARLVLGLLRFPTQAMYDGLTAKDKMWRDTNSTEVWQAFIDGALKE